MAEQDRAGPDAAAGRIGPADDRQLFAALAFDLEPAVAAARPVRRIGALEDDALELHLAGLAMEGVAVAAEMVAVADSVRRPREHGSESLLARDEARIHQRIAVEMEQIEGAIDGARRVALREIVLERRERAHAVRLQVHDFAVDDPLAQRQRGERCRDGRELVGPVMAVAAEELRLAAADAADHAIAVELDLVQPVVALRHVGDQRRQLRQDLFRQRCLACVLDGGRVDPGGGRLRTFADYRRGRVGAGRVPHAVARLRHLFQITAAHHAGPVLLDDLVVAARSRPLVLLFDESLTRSQFLPSPRRRRTSAQPPRRRLPCNSNLSMPRASAASGSSSCGTQAPSSQTMTAPPPYSPSGITPSKSP